MAMVAGNLIISCWQRVLLCCSKRIPDSQILSGWSAEDDHTGCSVQGQLAQPLHRLACVSWAAPQTWLHSVPGRKKLLCWDCLRSIFHSFNFQNYECCLSASSWCRSRFGSGYGFGSYLRVDTSRKVRFCLLSCSEISVDMVLSFLSESYMQIV